MSIYAFCGTLAAKVNLKSVFAERPESVSGFTETQGFPPDPLSTCRLKGFVEEELYESQHRTMPLFHIKPNVKEVPFRTSKTPSENREAFWGIQARYFVKSSENVVYLFVVQIYAAGLQ